MRLVRFEGKESIETRTFQETEPHTLQSFDCSDRRDLVFQLSHLGPDSSPYVRTAGEDKEKVAKQAGGCITAAEEETQHLVAENGAVARPLTNLMQEDVSPMLVFVSVILIAIITFLPFIFRSKKPVFLFSLLYSPPMRYRFLDIRVDITANRIHIPPEPRLRRKPRQRT